MSQSNYIAAAIAVAFLVFITAKGSLSNYLALMTGGAGFGEDTAAAGTSTTEQIAQASVDAAKDGTTPDAEQTAGPLDILGTVLQGTVGGQADEIIGSVAGKLGVGSIIGGFL